MKRLLVIVFPVVCAAVLLASWGLLHDPSTARGAEPPEAGTYEQAISMPGMVLRVALAMGLIVLLIVGAVYALRSLGARGRAETRGGVRVLDRCYLAPKRALYMVRMAGRVVVVGVTENSITPVLELSPEEGERMYPDGPSTPAESGRFSGILKSMTERITRSQV